MFFGWFAHGWNIALDYSEEFLVSTLLESWKANVWISYQHAVGSLGIGKPKTKDQIIPSGGFLVWSES